jgi:two-component system LytT family response regulator
MAKRPIRIIIAEDEAANSAVLRNIFEKHTDIELIAEARNGLELLALTSRLKPQAVFLDIEIPEMDGMTAAKKLMENDEDIIIVFVTCRPDFAAQAFEISSVDYILKPFTQERIEKALERIHSRLAERDLDRQKLANVFKSADKLYIRSGHELNLIDFTSIFYVEKERRRTVIHTGDNRYETHESINDLEKRLDKMNFFRSHKCYLINLKKIEKIIPWGDNSHLVKFFGSEKDALIARSKVKTLYDLLEISFDPQ